MTQPKIEGVEHGIPRMLYASDGSNWYAILVDSDGHVKIDVVSAALGTGAATSANQTTMITALQLIDDLRAALGSVNTDDLQVDVKTYPGVNALLNIPFGYNDRYAESISGLSTNGSGTANGTEVTTGEIWVINCITAFHDDPTARVVCIKAMAGATEIKVKENRNLAQYVLLDWQGEIVLKAGDKIRILGESLTTGKYVYGYVWGYKMKVA